MVSPWHARKLLTIIAEAALERLLIAEVRAAGGFGYTISEVRGGGQGGERAGEWEGERSIEFRVVCDEATAGRFVNVDAAKSGNSFKPSVCEAASPASTAAWTASKSTDSLPTDETDWDRGRFRYVVVDEPPNNESLPSNRSMLLLRL